MTELNVHQISDSTGDSIHANLHAKPFHDSANCESNLDIIRPNSLSVFRVHNISRPFPIQSGKIRDV
jgi:hypothetical protein